MTNVGLTVGDSKITKGKLAADVVGTSSTQGLKQETDGSLSVDWTAGRVNDETVKTLITNNSSSTIEGADDTSIVENSYVENQVLSIHNVGTEEVPDLKWKNQSLSTAGIQPTLSNATAAGSVEASTSGIMTAAQAYKLANIDATATNTAAPAYTEAIPVANSVLDDGAATVHDGLMSGAMATKLAGVATNAIADISGQTLAGLSDVAEPTVGETGYKLTGTNDGTNPVSYSWVRDDDDTKLDDLTGEIKADHLDFGTDKTGDNDQISTTDLPEGTKLYHTVERVQDITGAQLKTNGTHTGISFAYDADGDGAIDATVSLSGFDADDLSEASSNPTNKYFTNERVDDRVYQLDGSTETGLLRTGTKSTDASNPLTWAYDDVAGTLTPSISLAPFNTDALGEAAQNATNLWYTDDRVSTKVGTMSSATATASTIVKWDENKNINSDGVTIGSTGIVGLADTDINVLTHDTDDSVVIKFGSAVDAKTITIANNGITAAGAGMELKGFTADGGTLTAQGS